MSTVKQIEEAIRQLPPNKVCEVRTWLTEYDNALWDRQIEADVAAGKLDAIADEALREHREGKTCEL